MIKPSYYSIILPLIFSQSAAAQIAITSPEAYSQTFNTLAPTGTAAWINNNTLPGWYAQSADSTPGTLQANTGAVTAAGLYSLGTDGSADRALGGFGTSATSFLSYGVRLVNNTGATIPSFTVSFTLEQWYLGGGSSETLTFLYRTGTGLGSLSAGTWTAVPVLSASSPAKGKAGTRDGNLEANRVQVRATLKDVNLAPGQEIFFKWQDARNNKSDDHGLGIDELTITPTHQITYYSRNAGSLNDLTTWGTNPDGSGSNPENFTSPNQVFRIQNNKRPYLNGHWVVSGNNAKVILGNGTDAVNLSIGPDYYFQGLVDIQDAATLTLAHNTLPVLGTLAPNSTLLLETTQDHVLTANAFGHLTLAGAGTKSLSANTTIAGLLTLQGGKLQLHDYNLRIAPSGGISGGSATSFVLTDGGGTLQRMVPANNNAVLFPVGNPTYTPAELIQPPGSTADFFSARVFKGAYPVYDLDDSPMGDPFTSKAVDRTWIVDEETAGGSNLTLKLYWSQAEVLPGYTINENQVSHCAKGVWEKSTPRAAVLNNNSMYSNSMSGITTFSPFINNNPETPLMSLSTLPIELLSFTAGWRQQQVLLSWSTATEQNNAYFSVQASEDGKTFREIGQVKGAGNSQVLRHYTFTLRPASQATTYYRLKQTDFDQSFTYSGILAVTAPSGPGAQAEVFPNPGRGLFYIRPGGAAAATRAFVTDLTGRTVLPVRPVSPSGDGSILDLSSQAPGVYLLHLAGQGARQVLRLVKE